jgi:Sensors of blue-light using FAD
MDGLLCLLYMSRATREMAPGEIDGLLERARARNASLGVTGALLHYGGRFMQVLEGDAGAVEGCFRRILDDPRHTQVTRLHGEVIAAPRFKEWSMRYISAAGTPDRAVESFLDRLEHQPTPDSVRQAIELLHRLSSGSADWQAR